MRMLVMDGFFTMLVLMYDAVSVPHAFHRGQDQPVNNTTGWSQDADIRKRRIVMFSRLARCVKPVRADKALVQLHPQFARNS